MSVSNLLDLYLVEITKAEQLKLSVQKVKARKVEPRGDSQYQKTNFKNRLDLKKDAVKHAEKRVDYYDKEVAVRDKEREQRKKDAERAKKPGILQRLRGNK